MRFSNIWKVLLNQNLCFYEEVNLAHINWHEGIGPETLRRAHTKVSFQGSKLTLSDQLNWVNKKTMLPSSFSNTESSISNI
jgi:hypothetical protein